MEFHDPRGEPTAPVTPYAASARLGDGETIGLFANGFPDSVAFLEHVGAALRRALPGIAVRLWDKGDASALATEADLDEIAATCAGVVAAYGH